MISERWTGSEVYIYRQPVDMRKAIDGLSVIVATEFDRNPADRAMYVFANKGKDKVKLLIWHLNPLWRLRAAHLKEARPAFNRLHS